MLAISAWMPGTLLQRSMNAWGIDCSQPTRMPIFSAMSLRSLVVGRGSSSASARGDLLRSGGVSACQQARLTCGGTRR